jgi:hypothetical protein
MNVFAIDPGTHKSGWVKYEGGTSRILGFGVAQNEDMLRLIEETPLASGFYLAIEMIASYGMAVGAEVFETCVWVGRFQQAWHTPKAVRKVYRNEVKMHLCHSTKAKDANVRQALLDLFPQTGEGKVPQIGTKKKPGPLFGVSTHVWPALGVAIATHHRLKQAPTPSTRRVRLV